MAACLVGVAGLVLALMYWLWHPPSLEEQLRAIDAAHAIPDEENAAPDYADIFLGTMGLSLDPKSLPQAVERAPLSRPWRSADYPAAAQWIEERRATVDALLNASRKPRCWFPVAQAMRLRGYWATTFYDGACFLLRAANNDLGEGRVEAGLEKLCAVLRMGEHFRSQIEPGIHMEGIMIAMQALVLLENLLLNDDVPVDWLPRFEAALPPVEDTSSQDFQQSEKIHYLYMLERRENVGRRLLYRVIRATAPRTGVVNEWYYRPLTEFRVARILLELHQYRSETGAWPADLDEIRRRVPPDTFLDPFTHAPFDCQSSGSTFRLQTSSRGWITIR